MTRTCAIYLVANRRSERDCERLVTSIRESGCRLPIMLIPFNDDAIQSIEILREVTVVEPHEFPREAHEFVEELAGFLTCPQGFLRRFYAFFGPFDSFIYSDNDIIALSNWEEWVDRLKDYDLLHADEEYITEGRFNFENTQPVIDQFGDEALKSAITAGHFMARRSEKLTDDMRKALIWMKNHRDACKLHDQTLMHVASLIGNWDCLNLCKEPDRWLSSWAGDYHSTLELIQAGQCGRRISHLHYSGFSGQSFSRGVDPMRVSHLDDVPRNRLLAKELLLSISGARWVESKWKRLKHRLCNP